MSTVSPRVSSLHRYPIKGFMGETIQSVNLRAGSGIPFDRAFAITNGEHPVKLGGIWVPCQAFVRLTKNPNLPSYRVRFDEAAHTAVLQDYNGVEIALTPEELRNSPKGQDVLTSWFGNSAQPVVRCGSLASFGWSGYWDHEDAAISLVNLETVALLERHACRPLDPLRFRANLYIDRLAPGEEYALIGRRVQIGGSNGAILEIIRPIDRCLATSVDPTTGDRGINVPALLIRALGHVFCGVYARVVKDGSIAINDTVRDLGPAALAARDGSLASTAPQANRWPRHAHIVERVQESVSATSFWLDDPLTELRSPLRAGQHLRVHLIDHNGNAVWRAYTISGVEGSRLRLSIKRTGAVSRQLQDSGVPGTTLQITGPFGDVILPHHDDPVFRPLLLLSAGIGITPMVAMLRQLAETNDNRPVRITHVARDQTDLALWNEVLTIARRLPCVSIRLHLTQAPESVCISLDARGGRPDWKALWTKAEVKECDAFICGPSSFIAEARAALEEAGASPERISFELFVSPRLTPIHSIEEECGEFMHEPVPVRFAASGIEATWTTDVNSLLDLAEAAGLSPPAKCRNGACTTCCARLLSGTVVHNPKPALPIPDHQALLCCARPAPGEGALVIDL